MIQPVSPALRAALATVALLAATPALAAPLTFGEIASDTDLSRAPELALCAPAPSDDARPAECRLLRQSLGGIEIRDSDVRLNAEGRPTSIDIRIAGEDADLAYQLLVGRYGAPAAEGARTDWRGFDDGATLSLVRGGDAAVIGFRYPVNAAAAEAAAPLGAGARQRALVYMLVFIAVGLITGGLLARMRRPRRTAVASTAPEMSMRATLERRLRDGKGLEF
jgi:hypothetical protein